MFYDNLATAMSFFIEIAVELIVLLKQKQKVILKQKIIFYLKRKF